MEFKIFDLHNDILTGCDNVLSQLNLYKKDKNSVVCAYFRGNRDFLKAISDIQYFNQIKPKQCYLALEDIGYDNFDNIKTLLNLNPLYISLTWNGENVLGYGCNFDNQDIKPLGLEVIKLANQHKIIMDTAHISNRGFYTIIDKADKVICSHTAFKSIFDHKRNITDEQIKLIIEKGGVIGLCLYRDFIGNTKNELENLIKHIDYFVNKFGYDNLCIGTDFFGAKNFINSINNYKNFSKILEKLFKIGYNIKVINKIFFNNAQKYIKYTLQS